MVDSKLLGSFVYESSENIEAYIKAAGVDIDMAKLASMAPTEVTISVSEDGEWTSAYTGAESKTTTFRLGEESQVEGPGGQLRKQTSTVEGNKLISVMTLPDGKIETKTTEFTEAGLTSTMEIDGVVASTYFKRK